MTPPSPAAPKLIACDMDGTLLNSQSRISARTAAAIEAVTQAGIMFVPVTGRSRWSLYPMLADAGLVDGVIPLALCSNGGTILDVAANHALSQATIPPDLVVRSLRAVRGAFGEVAFAYELATGIVDGPGWQEIRALGHDDIFVAANEIVDAEPPEGPLAKIMVAHPDLTGQTWLDAIAPLLPDGVRAGTAGASFAEIAPPASEKSLTLAEICRQRGIEAAEVVAFGDHLNDLGMLEWAGYAYAMANAHPAAIEAADAQAPHHDEDGVAQVLETWV